MKIFKFGGASVKDATAVENVARIIKQHQNEKLIVVVSAMGKTTDLLETLVRAYFYRKEEKWTIFNRFKKFHTEICDKLFAGEIIPDAILSFFAELELKLIKFPSLNYNFEYDQIVSIGELVSTRIVSEYLNSASIKNQWVDVRNCIRTDDVFRDASIDWGLTEEFSQEVYNFKSHDLYITQGFIGSTSMSLTTTLGREGSDFSAAILGNVLNAEDVTFWKDVPGVLSADPKKSIDAKQINALSYREAVEITHSGAKVIHPKTMKPLHNKKIPLFVKSFLEPDIGGTVIEEIDSRIDLPPIFILKENLVLITLSPKDFSFISIEDIERIVNFMLEHRVKVTLMQQSAIDLNLVIDAPDSNLKEIFDELTIFYSIRYNTDLTLITIRHYTEENLDKIVKEKDIYLEQHSRLTARMLVKS